MADGRHLEKSKNGHISATVSAIGTKYMAWCHIDPQKRTGTWNLKLLTIQDGRWPLSWKSQNGYVCTTVSPLSTKFGTITHIEMALRTGRLPFWKIKTAISWQQFNRSPPNLICWRILIIWTVLWLPYVRVSPDTSSFRASVRESGWVFENRRFFWVFGQIRKFTGIRMLPIAQAYDGTRQGKLVSFRYRMSVTSQNAILVQASCTCLLNKM